MNIINKIRWGQGLSLLGYFALMAGLYLWHLVINKTEEHLISVIVLFQIGPLLFPAKGLLAGRIYTHAWSIYLAIAYFIVGVWYSSAADSKVFGLYVILASLVFMIGCIIYTRYASLYQKQNQGEDTP